MVYDQSPGRLLPGRDGVQMMSVLVRRGLEDGLWVRSPGNRRRRCGGTAVSWRRSEGGLEQKRCADGGEQRGSPRRIVGRRVLWDDHKRWVGHLGSRRCLYWRSSGARLFVDVADGDGREKATAQADAR